MKSSERHPYQRGLTRLLFKVRSNLFLYLAQSQQLELHFLTFVRNMLIKVGFVALFENQIKLLPQQHAKVRYSVGGQFLIKLDIDWNFNNHNFLARFVLSEDSSGIVFTTLRGEEFQTRVKVFKT